MVRTLLDVYLKMTTLVMLVTVSFSCKFSPECVHFASFNLESALHTGIYLDVGLYVYY